MNHSNRGGFNPLGLYVIIGTLIFGWFIVNFLLK